VPFTVTVSASSGAGLRYAYVHGTNAAVAVSYNSTGGVSAVTTLGPGEWLVWLPGPARPRRRAGCRSCGQPGQARRLRRGAAVVSDVNCDLLSGAMDPPSHWSVTTRIPDPAPVTPAVEILWRSGVNWRITRIELWIGLWVKKFLPELAGRSCQARRRGDKK
jgi:hypothetical protein